MELIVMIRRKNQLNHKNHNNQYPIRFAKTFSASKQELASLVNRTKGFKKLRSYAINFLLILRFYKMYQKFIL